MSRKKAIDAFCRQCIVDPGYGRGTWRQQTEACPSEKTCPLWIYRPTSKGVKELDTKIVSETDETNEIEDEGMDD